MIIIKVILWTLLAVLLIAALAFSLPVRVVVRYNDEISLVIKYLFLKFPIDLNGDESSKKQKPTKKNKKIIFKKTVKNKSTAVENRTVVTEKKAESKKKSISKNLQKNKKNPQSEKKNAAAEWLKNTFKERGLRGILNVFKEIAKLTVTFLKPIFKHIKIKRLDLNITVAFEDAADTAVNYGYFCAGIYPSLSVLLRNVKYSDYNVNIAPDFNKKEPEFDVLADVSVIPWFVIFGAVHALFNYIVLKAKGKI